MKQMLGKFTKLFDGTLGVYPHRKFHIDFEPNVKPKHARSYPIPIINQEAFKKELKHLCTKVYYHHKEQANGLLPPLSHPRKMAEFVGSVT